MQHEQQQDWGAGTLSPSQTKEQELAAQSVSRVVFDSRISSKDALDNELLTTLEETEHKGGGFGLFSLTGMLHANNNDSNYNDSETFTEIGNEDNGGNHRHRRNKQAHPHESDKSETLSKKAEADTAAMMTKNLAQRETRAIILLRVAVLLLLVLAATLVSVGVFIYTENQERFRFEREFHSYAETIIDSLQRAVEQRLGGINAMATSITSYALATSQEFPFVTLPHFAMRGSDARILADAMVIHYMPLVTDEKREKWEEYALKNRFHIDEEFKVDEAMRRLQDKEYLPPSTDEQVLGNRTGRKLATANNNTVLQDGTGFRPRIWSVGALTPARDEAEGTGPFIPLWQRSPINGARQRILNWNFANTFAFRGVLPALLETNQAIMHQMARPATEEARENFKANLAVSQYRYDVGEFVDDPATFIAYPVFDTFDLATRQVAGLLATNIHWKIFFERILPDSVQGIICVFENSYNQTFSYMIDGRSASFLGESDFHDSAYDDLMHKTSINDFKSDRSFLETRSYTQVPLSDKYGRYTLRVYPSRNMEESYETGDPALYTCIVAAVFVFTSVIFIFFVIVVERRQTIIMNSAVMSARKVANTERELNEFLSHEVRNPLSAAIAACSFVSSAVGEQDERDSESSAAAAVSEFKATLQEDVRVIETSLQFVNEFLRSMLDMHRAAIHRLEFKLAPANVLKDIITPVHTMIYQRNVPFSLLSDCNSDLAVVTDSMRMKQILLNLVVNSSKFVASGFIRLKASVVNGLVELCVEDSGPGIPMSKRAKLFDRYENRLDELSQGTGIGLGLSKNLVESLGGEMWLDDSYNSGIPGSPGARFVIQLRKAPVDIRNSPPIPPFSPPPPILAPFKKANVTTLASKDDADTGNSSLSGTADSLPPNGLQNLPGNLAMVENTSSPVKRQLPPDLSVLFVDDDPILRKLFARAIKRVAPNWVIEQAPDGQTALDLIANDKTFDLIFMDQYMPSTCKTLLGTETIVELRANGVQSRICGLSANDLDEEFLRVGADCFKTKPIPADKTDLQNWLIEILG